MTAIVIVIALLAALLINGVIYSYFIRSFLFWSKGRIKNKMKVIKIVILILSAFFSVFAINVFSVVSIILLHITALVLITEIINIIIRKIYTICERKENKPKLWNTLYLSGLLPLLVSAVMLTYGYININNIRCTHYNIYTDKSIIKDNYRICLIADLHFGNAANEEKLQKQCEKISKENVDLVVLCGDIVDENTTYKEMKAAFAKLGNIKSESGVYYVFGNHDISGYIKTEHYTQEDIRSALSENNIKVLEDSAVQLDSSFVIVGRKDRSQIRSNIYSLVMDQDENDFILVLDHQPSDYAKSADAGVDLLLSGHTHGGQIWPAGFFIKILGLSDLCYGYKRNENFQAIVTSGISAWGYPVRTDSISEYVIIDIQKK